MITLHRYIPARYIERALYLTNIMIIMYSQKIKKAVNKNSFYEIYAKAALKYIQPIH